MRLSRSPLLAEARPATAVPPFAATAVRPATAPRSCTRARSNPVVGAPPRPPTRCLRRARAMPPDASLHAEFSGRDVEGCTSVPPPAPSVAFAQLLDWGAGGIALGGHRGMGANPWCAQGSTRLPARFRENTVASMQAAACSGVTFMEFDVQVTSDGVPVIWHDNYVVFGEPAAPESRLVCDMALAEFKALAPINGHLELGTGAAAEGVSATARRQLLRQHLNDAPAVAGEPTLRAWEVDEEDHLPTLAEVFAALPPSIAFDIELKMTTHHTVPRTDPAEVDRVLRATLCAVDAALATQHRDVLFSSFDPDVCAELKSRRPEFPVMFLTGGGAYPHADARRTSLPASLDFAAAAGLQGVIVEAASLRRQAHLVAAALDAGLQVMTYGLLNDEPAWVVEQQALGVHGVIVDDVGRVAAALLVGN